MPTGPGESMDVNGRTCGVDGVGEAWVQPFVKGLCLGLRQTGNEGQVWIAAGKSEYADNWMHVDDFIKIGEFMPCVSPTDVGIFMHSDPRSRHYKAS